MTLTPEHIAGAIRQSSQDLPGGLVRGERERQVRSVGLVKTAEEEIADIEVRTGPAGDRVLVSDVAKVYENFDVDQPAAFKQGQSAVQMSVFRTGSTDALQSLETVRKYVDGVRANLPQGMELVFTTSRLKSINAST